MGVEILEDLKRSVKNRFDKEKRILSFEDFMGQVHASPEFFLRPAADWISDAFRYYEKHDKHVEQHTSDVSLFREHYPDRFQPVFGQLDVQRRLRKSIEAFAKSGRVDKVLVLHGPNGSAKTTLCRNLFAALEKYSQDAEGALYTFSWVFPLSRSAKGPVGIGGSARDNSVPYSMWPQDDLGAILRSELHENPLLLIPKEERKAMLEFWKKSGKVSEEKFGPLRERFQNAELSHKTSMIFETLLNEYQGDLLQVFKHVRVERFYLSYQMRCGLAVIEPQFGMDAQVRQITLDQSLANLPPALQSLNLYQLEGDLVTGNRGVVEFNDLLKRPLEAFKYLLSLSETSRLQLGPYSAQLDTILVATTNDHQLEAFREHPEFVSFRGRFELLRVPYLLKYTDEAKIYEREVSRLKETKEVLPHTSEVLALWAVMSRLKKPMTKNKSALLTKILDSLSPLEKARAYNDGYVPERFADEEKREFKAQLPELFSEHQTQPFYEGMIGPSARELRLLLQHAAFDSDRPALGPLAIIRELKNHIQRKQDYEYLRLENVGPYHDYPFLIELAYHEWLRWVDEEIREVVGMGQLPKIRETLQDYVQKVMMLVRGEKIKNRITGKSEMPNAAELEVTEKLLGINESLDEFRQNMLGRLGAWSVENKRTLSGVLPFEEIFPDLVARVRSSFKKEEDLRLEKMGEVFAEQDISLLSQKRDVDDNELSDGERLAILAYRGLQKKKGYGPHGALEAIGEYIRYRFRSEVKK